MQRSIQLALGAGVCLVLALLLALPILASSKDDDRAALLNGNDVVFRGIDVWVTPADGQSHSDFSQEPIPAGFFCQGSAPFSGRIVFKGESLNTAPAGVIGGSDTIIERLDDAVFDADGVATTRIRFLALSLVSIEPIQTECGQFQAHLRLEGEQPLTAMRIQRQGEYGGVYDSDISVRAKLTFTPLGGGSPLVFSRNVQFDHLEGAPWARLPGQSSRPAADYARVDVDGDGQAETAIPGPGNFQAGCTPGSKVLAQASAQQLREVFESTLAATATICHCDSTQTFESTSYSSSLDTSSCIHLHCSNNPGVYYPVAEESVSSQD